MNTRLAFVLPAVFVLSSFPTRAADKTDKTGKDLYLECRAQETKDPDAALAACEQAAVQGYPKAHKVIGDIKLRAGKRPDAVEAYRRYLAADPQAKDAELIREMIKRLGGTP